MDFSIPLRNRHYSPVVANHANYFSLLPDSTFHDVLSSDSQTILTSLS
jgi:hypothetical protein